MKSIVEMTQLEIAAFVQTHLKRRGIHVVLSGGAAVSLYSKSKYVSLDLDLVNIHAVGIRSIRASMEEIGFSDKGRYFKHPESEYPVEFPPGPLAFGDEQVAKVNDIKLTTGLLKIISPTDCVKDRLAAFYHWGDRQCLQQAVMVAQSQDVNMEEIENWSDKEGKSREFDEFKSIES